MEYLDIYNLPCGLKSPYLNTGHFAQKTFCTSLLAQVLESLHNSQWSFCTTIISEKHQYKKYTY